MLAAAPAAVILVFVAASTLAVGAATLLSELWTAGGLSAGTDSAGQAARIASDAAGNVAVVSGPSGGRDLAVTSYTADGAFRWRSSVSPSLGTFQGDWVTAAPNGDVLAVGHNVDSRGNPIQSTLVRFASDGTLLWRVDPSVGFFPTVGRLLVDADGNAYLAVSGRGTGAFVQKYSPSGALLWSRLDSTGSGYAIASSLALSPDGADVAVTGSVLGGAIWNTAVFDAATGVRRWQATAAEGTAARDVVVDAARVYVTGQGATGAGTPALKYFLTVIAYDRATGARLWRKDKKPADASDAAGLRMALAPDGSLAVTGQTNRGFLDWYTVAFETTGAVRWEAVRDGGLNTDEIPAAVLVLADGTTVVSGKGGPNLPGGYIPGVTAGYSSNGELLWEAFSRMATAWATALPNGDVCAAGGYDAFITCWRVSGAVSAVMSAAPSTGVAPLLVSFDGSRSTTPNGSITSWAWSFGDGAFGTGPLLTHLYTNPGTYAASLTVTDSTGASSVATTSIVANPSPPAAPSGLTASQSGFLVQLTWQDNSSNETVFYIERCQGVGCIDFGSFIATQWPDVPSYTDYSAMTGQTYRYRVRAYNSGGYSAYSNIASILVGAANQPPTAVISAVPTTGVAPLSVVFNGSGSSDPDGTIATWAWSFGDGTSGSGPTITHVYTAAGFYIANLTVTDNAGASSTASATISVTTGSSTAPSAPNNLAARSNSRARINLTWINTATNATSITVERCSGSACTGFAAVAQLAATAKSWTDAGVESRSTYRYRVSASNAAGRSPYSNIASATAR
jgi:PKD repeat protein